MWWEESINQYFFKPNISSRNFKWDLTSPRLRSIMNYNNHSKAFPKVAQRMEVAMTTDCQCIRGTSLWFKGYSLTDILPELNRRSEINGAASWKMSMTKINNVIMLKKSSSGRYASIRYSVTLLQSSVNDLQVQLRQRLLLLLLRRQVSKFVVPLRNPKESIAFKRMSLESCLRVQWQTLNWSKLKKTFLRMQKWNHI